MRHDELNKLMAWNGFNTNFWPRSPQLPWLLHNDLIKTVYIIHWHMRTSKETLRARTPGNRDRHEQIEELFDSNTAHILNAYCHTAM